MNTTTDALNLEHAEDLALLTELNRKAQAASAEAMRRLYGVTDPEEARSITADADGYGALRTEARAALLRKVGSNYDTGELKDGSMKLRQVRGWRTR